MSQTQPFDPTEIEEGKQNFHTVYVPFRNRNTNEMTMVVGTCTGKHSTETYRVKIDKLFKEYPGYEGVNFKPDDETENYMIFYLHKEDIKKYTDN